MRISNDDIIISARRQRQMVDRKMAVPPFKGTPPSSWGKWVGAIAASLIGFAAGFGLRANTPQPTVEPVAQTIQIQHDTIMQVQTVRDTIYRTRIVTRYEKPMMAETEEEDIPAEQNACSMLCDNIPYELLSSIR